MANRSNRSVPKGNLSQNLTTDQRDDIVISDESVQALRNGLRETFSASTHSISMMEYEMARQEFERMRFERAWRQRQQPVAWNSRGPVFATEMPRSPYALAQAILDLEPDHTEPEIQEIYDKSSDDHDEEIENDRPHTQTEPSENEVTTAQPLRSILKKPSRMVVRLEADDVETFESVETQNSPVVVESVESTDRMPEQISINGRETIVPIKTEVSAVNMSENESSPLVEYGFTIFPVSQKTSVQINDDETPRFQKCAKSTFESEFPSPFSVDSRESCCVGPCRTRKVLLQASIAAAVAAAVAVLGSNYNIEGLRGDDIRNEVESILAPYAKTIESGSDDKLPDSTVSSGNNDDEQSNGEIDYRDACDALGLD